MAEPITPNRALERAIDIVGSQSSLARLLGVTQGAVSKWIAQGKPLPPEHVLTVERETGISRHDLRPDVYGPASTATPDAPGALEAAR